MSRLVRAIELTLFATVIGAVVVAVTYVLTGCTSDQVHQNTPGIVDSVKGVLSATGLGMFNPLVDSAGKIALWLAGPPAVGTACVYHKYRGIPYVGSRRRKLKEDDNEWDEAAEQLQQLANATEKVANSAGNEHLSKQARVAQTIAAALKAKQPAPKRKKVPVAIAQAT